MKKTMAMILAATLLLSAFVGCGKTSDAIHVVSREDGSGTRGALIDLIARDAQQAASCMDFLMIAKYFERIGDHAQNIADWVLYVLQGELPARDDTRQK